MNPLTQVKNLQKITDRETAAGVSDEGSWHAKYKGSAYIFAGGLPFDLTEGDLLAVFAQYGEVVDLNLVRYKGTGKSKGFAFIAYEDQRSTVLAVDNLNGGKLLGRTIRVDHVLDYKRKLEEDEEEEQRKREERGVCYAFQRGECTRGSGCKFSHDEQRNANTGWGPGSEGPKGGPDRGHGAEGPKWGRGADGPKWAHDRYEDSKPPDGSDSARLKDADRKSRFDEVRPKGVEDSRSKFDASTAGDDRRSRYDDRRGRGFEDGSRIGDEKRLRGPDGWKSADEGRGRHEDAGHDGKYEPGDDRGKFRTDKRPRYGHGGHNGRSEFGDDRGRHGADRRSRFSDGLHESRAEQGDDRGRPGSERRSRFSDGPPESRAEVADDRARAGTERRSRFSDSLQEGRTELGDDRGKPGNERRSRFDEVRAERSDERSRSTSHRRSESDGRSHGGDNKNGDSKKNSDDAEEPSGKEVSKQNDRGGLSSPRV